MTIPPPSTENGNWTFVRDLVEQVICATDLLEGVFWNPIFREALAEPREIIVCPRKLLRESALVTVKNVRGEFRPILSHGRLLPSSPLGIEVCQKAAPARIATHEKGLMESLAVPALRVLRDFASTAGHVLGSDNQVLLEWAALAHFMGVTRYRMHTPFFEREFRRQTRRAHATVCHDLPGSPEVWPDLYDLYAERTLPRELQAQKRLARAFIEFLFDRLMRALNYYASVPEKDIADAVRSYYRPVHALPRRLRRFRYKCEHDPDFPDLAEHYDHVGLLTGVQNALSDETLLRIAAPLRRPKLRREGRYVRGKMRRVYEEEYPTTSVADHTFSTAPRIRTPIPDPPLAGLTAAQSGAVKTYAEACRMGYGRWSKSRSLRRYWGEKYWSRMKNVERARKRSPAVEQWFSRLGC
jgi:hypothetical protein